MNLFKRQKKTKQLDDSVAMRITVQGESHEVNFQDLCLSNTRSIQALAGLLIRKKVITGEELLEEVKRQSETFQPLTVDDDPPEENG